MASYKATSPTAARIRLYLFLIELSLAVIATVISAYIILKTFRSSWTSGLLSTFLALWIGNTVTSLFSYRSPVNEGMNNGDDDPLTSCDDDDHGLQAFESMRESKMQSYSDTRLKLKRSKGEEEEDEGSYPQASQEFTDTKSFLGVDENNEHTSKISFPLLAVLGTVLLQFTVRLLVIAQHLRRLLPWRRRRVATNGSIQFSDIPFIIGRHMSFSGCSFRVLSFLNGWLAGLHRNGDLGHGSCDAHTDNSVDLEAVRFDCISINSSHFIINPPRKHAVAKNQISWLGIRFEDIGTSLTILFKRKERKRKEEAINDKCIQSITIQFKMKALEIGVFPSPLDWCKGIGMHLNVEAMFHAGSSPECGKHSSLLGIGVSLASNHFNMHRFSSKDRIISWDKVQSSLHLFPNGSEDDNFRTPVSLLMMPSGFVSIHGTREGNTTLKPASDSPHPKQTYMNLGDNLCGNRLAVGVHLEDLQTSLQLMEILLQNMSSIPISTKIKRETKKKKSAGAFELNAAISLHLYTLISPVGTRAQENNYFSFEAPHSVLRYVENNTEFPLLVADARDVSLRNEAFSGGRLSNTALDLIFMKQIKSKLIREHMHIDSGEIVARIDGEMTTNLAFIKKASEETRIAVANLQQSAKELKQTLSRHAQHNMGQKSDHAANQNRKPLLRQIDITCDSVDAIGELLGDDLSEHVNVRGNATRSDRVRFSLLQGKTSVAILRVASTLGEELSLNSNTEQPNQLFDLEVEKCGQHHLIQATVAHSEGSVTFHPHSSLPVIDQPSPDILSNIASGQNQEVLLYGQVSKLALKSTVPLNSSQVHPILVSKAMHVTFDLLNVYEQHAKRGVIGPSLFSIPVHQFAFRLNSADTRQNGWPMAQTYTHFTAADLIQIVQCRGNLCRVEKSNSTTREKVETISIQFSRSSTEMEIVWSPILQWFHVSLNTRIQRALAHLKNVASNKAPKKIVLSSHKTNIRIEMDPDVIANIHVFAGVKTKLHTVIKNGSALHIAMAKYQFPSTKVLKQFTKPNLSFNAEHINVYFNDITSPTFTLRGPVSVNNHLRRADDNEIKDYLSKKGEDPKYSCGDDLITDYDGHALKEIFELRLGSSTSVKLPPLLHFGECIQDIQLLPRALDDGLNRLKEGQKKQAKKYQLMSIKCIIPFLDVSLMDNDPDAENSTHATTKRTNLRDELRIFFENADVSIERNAPPEWTQSQMNALDEDKSSTHTYGPAIQGGLFSLTIKNVICTLHPLNIATPLLRMKDFSINGYLHMAGLSTTTPGIHEGKTVSSLLLCHHCHHGHFTHRQCCCCYGVTLHSTDIPVKFYTESRFTFEELDISYGAVMNESIPRMMECIQRVLPPPSKSPSQPLSWWDNLRFVVHGSIDISADKLSFRWLLDSHALRDQSILLTCQNFEIKHNVGLFDINASDINVSIPGVAYDMSVHPSLRDNKTFHLPHETESVVSQGRHPLVYVPSFKAHIKFSWEMLQPEVASSGHHSVYTKRQKPDVIEDKFASFRSSGITKVEFDFDLPGSDECDNWIALRMDVLPWFTHINSTTTYSSQLDKKEKDPLPELRSVAVKANIKEVKLVTWFEDEEGLDGLCLIVRTVNYSADVDGCKDIVIKECKAALLDVSEFKHHENSDEREEMMVLEQIASDFGISQSHNDSEVIEHPSRAESLPGDGGGNSSPFLKLQQLSKDIDELDYVAVTGQIDVHNQSLARMLAECEESCAKTSESIFEKKDSHIFAVVDRTTWSILVARCRLLWTIEIRDSIMAISKDFIYTVGFIKSQIRQLQVLSGNTSQQVHSARDSLSGEGVELSLHRRSTTDSALHESMIQYLLHESFDANLASAPSATQGSTFPDTTGPGEKEKKEVNALPTLDIHLSNPQVQLHSVATGGSIILAASAAHVEGRKFIHFLVTNQSKTGKVSPSDLLRKTEHTYTLTNMEAYSLSTNVDVNIGLPWLEVCSPGGYYPAQEPAALGEKFGINDGDAATWNYEKQCFQQSNVESYDSASSHEYTYPLFLRNHEPLPFLTPRLLCRILEPFTFQSTQLFHRQPIHYSTEELECFINQGLVVGQDEAAVDDIELQIDLLSFNLDSYQFKTTLDVIRNVLLEPPKPHQRHEMLDESDATQTSSRHIHHIRPTAANGLEEALRSDKKRGKKGRQLLRAAAMSLLRDLEDNIAVEGNEAFRRVSYNLLQLQWCIQSPDEIDDVKITFTGFNGTHDYLLDGSIASQFSLEDVRVSSARPGPDSMSFLDPTSVLMSVLGNERSPCQRCNQKFTHSKNDLTSCAFHPGHFNSGVWSCCSSSNSSALGCKRAPHTGKEHAAVVRVESLPRIVKGISLYTHFEVNLYPGISHTLAVQISKSMSRLFMSYFFLEGGNGDDLDDISISSDGTGTTDAISVVSGDSPKPTSKRKKMLIGGKGSPENGNPRTARYSEPTGYDDPSKFEISKEEAEIAFIKVWRVGYVDVNVSLGGFRRLPQTSLDISVPAYSRAYEIGTWEYHSRKYLTYLIREVVKSGASSGLDKFRRKVLGASVDSSPAQGIDQLQSSILEPRLSTRRSVPSLPTISDSSPVELESFIGRHLRRSVKMGASDILGTPAKNTAKKKNKTPFKQR